MTLSLRHAVTNPRFQVPLLRVTRLEQLSQYGRSTMVETNYKFKGTVTVPSDANLVRYVDSTTYTKAICVTSTIKFNPESKKGNGDVIIYKGDRYLVLGVDDYDQYGFTRAYAGLLNYEVSAQHGD